jgi:hypothetical protein
MATTQPKGLAPGDPYCSNCGYALKDLSESARCPECGKPLVEILVRAASASGSMRSRSIRIKSEITVLGWPLYHIALGPRPEYGEFRGVARGVFAVGDVAIGGIAFGGMACGGVAFGGMALGLCSFGGMAIGLLSAIGGAAIGGVAVGGAAAGGLATGGGALGFAAQGGGAIGYYARGGGAFGVHVIGIGQTPDPAAVEMFKTLAPVMGSRWGGLPMFASPLVAILILCLLVLFALGMCVMVGRKSPDPLNLTPERLP